jgi:hypothetical protein
MQFLFRLGAVALTLTLFPFLWFWSFLGIEAWAEGRRDHDVLVSIFVGASIAGAITYFAVRVWRWICNHEPPRPKRPKPHSVRTDSQEVAADVVGLLSRPVPSCLEPEDEVLWRIGKETARLHVYGPRSPSSKRAEPHFFDGGER